MKSAAFKNREEAGRLLANKIVQIPGIAAESPIVIALPRGGVPVAIQVARALRAPLDVSVVRKIGAPGAPELGIGAIAEDRTHWINQDFAKALGVDENALRDVIDREAIEVDRRVAAYRANRAIISVKNKTVILVDDGVAMGVSATMAARFLRTHGAKRLIMAVPVCAPDAAVALQKEVDEIYCLRQPSLFYGVGLWYEDFSQLDDKQVISMLAGYRKEHARLAEDKVPPEIAKEEPFSKRVKPFKNEKDLDGLINELAQKKVVMLGEASHGTHEFYYWRRVISQRLISEHGFNVIAVEGDWPDAMKIHRFINANAENDADFGSDEPTEVAATRVLYEFRRWPTWMWANTEIVSLMSWLKRHNKQSGAGVGFYGLDVYSLFESIEAVLEYLKKVNPFLARQFAVRYECFENFRGDEISYARSLLRYPKGCEAQAVDNLKRLLELRLSDIQTGTETDSKKFELWDAQQNSRIVANAERYYRAMMHGTDDSWNVRDRHMLETLKQILENHGKTNGGKETKTIVWAHNTHIGDYRATNMVDYGSINIGGLAREELGVDNVALVGFGTDRGIVVAAPQWGASHERMPLPAGRAQSYESIFHQVCKQQQIQQFFINFTEEDRQGELAKRRSHRAVGVVYDVREERWGNYVPTSLSNRYDAFVFIDETTGLIPLQVPYSRELLPETWPSGR